MTAGLPLMKNALTLLTKIVLLPLVLSAGMSAADTAIQKKSYGSGNTALIIFILGNFYPYIDFMLKSKNLLEYTNLKVKMYCNLCNKYRKSEKTKIS